MSDRLVKLEIESLKRQFKQQKSRAEKAEQEIGRLKGELAEVDAEAVGYRDQRNDERRRAEKAKAGRMRGGTGG